MATTTYNGKTYSRKTARTYTRAVGVTDAAPRVGQQDRDGIIAWCGSAELAQKAARKYSNPEWGFCNIEIVGVQS
jgi:hypothetical protein